MVDNELNQLNLVHPLFASPERLTCWMKRSIEENGIKKGSANQSYYYYEINLFHSSQAIAK